MISVSSRSKMATSLTASQVDSCDATNQHETCMTFQGPNLDPDIICQFYRRLPSTDTIDISVVMLSEFLDEDEEYDIKQLKDHFKAGFVQGEKGMLKCVYTCRLLKMCLYFSGTYIPPFVFKVDQPQLDSVGFVIDHFKRIAVKSPASRAVKISDIPRGDKNESLWDLNVCEKKERIQSDVVKV